LALKNAAGNFTESSHDNNLEQGENLELSITPNIGSGKIRRNFLQRRLTGIDEEVSDEFDESTATRIEVQEDEQQVPKENKKPSLKIATKRA